MTNFTTDQWIILGLVFVLGFLVGAWMTSGGRSKWKSRYNEEVTSRKALEAREKDRDATWATREKELRDEADRREAAARAAAVATPAGRADPYVDDRLRDRHPDDLNAPRRDLDRDGVPDNYDRRPLDGDRR
ncbi:alpha-beta hydrolase superfamily lysophospholipase [Sphingomonas kaistensis]|uniref:Alpha-beta hydrolase superfamily lysophospholipase n=1 Tax=Sphingomonas kaistensis TaxID=298708 RepID=A0A7X5Y6T8_9SPHN|nr:hypothetical protein [Sphingomonas kaistensis]NJC05642.1 alpha-beta hydrolase superfamily lysophospholipase [Sphingomonas kaistensis]